MSHFTEHNADKIDKPESKTWVALVSGLSVGNETSAPDLKSELFVEWLMGEIGGVQVCLRLSNS